tara:strand:+ start:63 stop:212 length:150 start_codon:yes stop_codon:yes gene_type:complete
VTTVEEILAFVNDHWNMFGAYPMEVETSEDGVLTWDQYWSYINEKDIEQ